MLRVAAVSCRPALCALRTRRFVAACSPKQLSDERATTAVYRAMRKSPSGASPLGSRSPEVRSRRALSLGSSRESSRR